MLIPVLRSPHLEIFTLGKIRWFGHLESLLSTLKFVHKGIHTRSIKRFILSYSSFKGTVAQRNSVKRLIFIKGNVVPYIGMLLV